VDHSILVVDDDPHIPDVVRLAFENMCRRALDRRRGPAQISGQHHRRHAMLEAHGGTIRLADSAEGAAFALTIPLADARAS